MQPLATFLAVQGKREHVSWQLTALLTTTIGPQGRRQPLAAQLGDSSSPLARPGCLLEGLSVLPQLPGGRQLQVLAPLQFALLGTCARTWSVLQEESGLPRTLLPWLGPGTAAESWLLARQRWAGCSSCSSSLLFFPRYSLKVGLEDLRALSQAEELCGSGVLGMGQVTDW